MARLTAADKLVATYQQLSRDIEGMLVTARAAGRSTAFFQGQLDEVNRTLARLLGAETEFIAQQLAIEYADSAGAATLSIPANRLVQGSFTGFDRAAVRALQGRVGGSLSQVREALTTGLALGDPRLSTDGILAALEGSDLVSEVGGVLKVRVPSGRMWDPKSYAKMLGRTAIADTRRVAFRQRYLQNGIDVVKVVGNGTNHPVCAVWEGESLSLTGATPGLPTVDDARSAGLFHPNCRHRYVMDTSAEQTPVPRELLGVPAPRPALPILGVQPSSLGQPSIPSASRVAASVPTSSRAPSRPSRIPDPRTPPPRRR